MMYILDENNVPVICNNILEWSLWMDQNKDKIRVAFDKIDQWEISTVFMGRSSFVFNGPPVCFETMVFNNVIENGSFDQDQFRYITWEEAEEGHKKVVEIIKAFVKENYKLLPETTGF